MSLVGTYRLRHPESTAFYQCLEDYWEEFKQNYPYFYERDYGPWRPGVEKIVECFLQCGILRHGFARLRCSDCRRRLHQKGLLIESIKGATDFRASRPVDTQMQLPPGSSATTQSGPDGLNQPQLLDLGVLGNEFRAARSGGTEDESIERIANRAETRELVELVKI